MSEIAKTPKPPYYAVIFTSLRTEGDDDGYAEMAARMEELATRQKGFLGIESAREELGITVSYWESLEAIADWRQNSEHKLTQIKGYETWYQSFKTRVCLAERDYEFKK